MTSLKSQDTVIDHLAPVYNFIELLNRLLGTGSEDKTIQIWNT